MQVPASEGGPPNQSAFAASPYGAPYTYQIFGSLSNELSTPKMLVCPSDERTAHTNFNMLAGNSAAGAYLANATSSLRRQGCAGATADAAGGRPQYRRPGARRRLPDPFPAEDTAMSARSPRLNFNAGPRRRPDRKAASNGNVLISDQGRW
jgi:hypothetical protein